MSAMVLWGHHPGHASDVPVILVTGDERVCNAERRYRRAHGWRGLVILPAGRRYSRRN